jgi:hypothetical protein
MLPVVMLNPSTADADFDDPTIRRCMGFARREGHGGVLVGNLFGLRSPTPDILRDHGQGAFGIGNESALLEIMAYAVQRGVPLLCAWGVYGAIFGAGAEFVSTARHIGVPLVCLGKTKEGHPRHPLYVRGDKPFEAFA